MALDPETLALLSWPSQSLSDFWCYFFEGIGGKALRMAVWLLFEDWLQISIDYTVNLLGKQISFQWFGYCQLRNWFLRELNQMILLGPWHWQMLIEMNFDQRGADRVDYLNPWWFGFLFFVIESFCKFCKNQLQFQSCWTPKSLQMFVLVQLMMLQDNSKGPRWHHDFGRIYDHNDEYHWVPRFWTPKKGSSYHGTFDPCPRDQGVIEVLWVLVFRNDMEYCFFSE